jgi:hypothetical protein
MKTKTIIEMDYREVDNLISTFLESKGYVFKSNPYNHRYECLAMEEWNNDSYHQVELDGSYDETILEYIKGNDIPNYNTYEILNLMVSEKLIPVGEYLITVGW